MNIKRTLISTGASTLLAAASTGLAQPTVNTFTPGGMPPSTEWHFNGNWDQGHWPRDDEYALIPENLTCIISSQAAVALGVIVEDDAVLGVEGGQSLTLYGVVEDEEDAIEIEPDGLLYVKESGGGTRSSIIFQAPDNSEEYGFRIYGGGTPSADVDAGYGEARLINPVGYIARIDLLTGTTITGSFEFERLSIDNSGTIEVNGTDEMIVGSSTGNRYIEGDGTLQVSGASAVFSTGGVGFGGIYIDISGTITVTDGLMAWNDLPSAIAEPFDGSITIDGGELTVEGTLRCRGVEITIEDGGEMVVDDDLDLRLDGWSASSLTLAADAGDVDVLGDFLLDETQVIIGGGLLSAMGADAMDSSVIITDGELELNGEYLGTTTDLTVSGGTLDINDDLYNEGDFALLGGEITLAVDQLAVFAPNQ